MGEMILKNNSSDVIDYEFLKVKLSPPKKARITDTGRETSRLLKELGSMLYVKKEYKKTDYTSSKRGSERKQPCIVKMFYGTDKRIHKNFLREYMTQQNKDEVDEKPKLFNAGYDEVPEEELLRYEQNMDNLHFRFIISPDSQKVPLKNLVRSFISQLEKATGFSFTWMAVEHHNTEKQHSHVLINGIDKKTGKKIRFDRSVIRETARNLAVNICTDLVGLQTQEQVNAMKERQPFAYRYTNLDRNIESLLTIFDPPKSFEDGVYESEIICRDELMRKRLSTLVDMGLARCFSKNIPPVYYLEKKWADKLRSAGRYNTFLKARRDLRYTPSYNLEQYTKDTGKIEGVVTQCIVQNDDDAWNNAVVVENRQLGKSWYLPLKSFPKEDVLGAAVQIAVERNQHGLLSPNIRVVGGRNERS